MVTFRTFNDLVVSMVEFLRLVQPDLDTKPGTVSRDLFIDVQSEQLANFYNELRNVSVLQSFFTASGIDLERLGSNFGVQRLPGFAATGTAVLTTDSLDIDVLITENTIFTARNGVTFRTTDTTLMSSANANVFRANATRLRADLELAGITDIFAVEVSVEAVTTGTGGNVGRFSLISQNIPGINNITNLNTFSGGINAESDAEFRNRILSVFAGSNTGTALGYETTIRTNPNVSDVIVVVPGDPLLIRDGTQTAVDIDGNLIVADPGTGGKVDIYILGQDLQSNIDSFIYNDQSGRNDATNSDNDFILGQQGEDPTLNSIQRRVSLIAENALPLQPVENIISVVGSLSGGNFIEKFTDVDGAVKGNFELIKDTGDLKGSPFGFDKLHWISNQVDLDDESSTKGVFNGSDALDFTDVLEIRKATQDILVTNENPTISTTNRSSIQLHHTPVRVVSRATNLTTGERYIVTNQNPDGTAGELNTTGRILISGNTLPAGTDILQVDYTWVMPFDNLADFDNLKNTNVFRTVQDSVDWSFSNLVSYEPATVVSSGGDLIVEVTHNISRVLQVATFATQTVAVSNGTVILGTTVNNVIDMRRVSDGVEVFNTDLANGALSGTTNVILPTDTLAEDGDSILVRFNTEDLFAPDGYAPGTFENNTIILTDGVFDGYVPVNVLVSYVADVRTLLPTTNLEDLPALRDDNNFDVDGSILGEQPTSNLTTNSVITNNLRLAPSNIRVDAASIGAPGTLGVFGTSSTKLTDVLVVITGGNGFDINLSSAILADLGTNVMPSTISISKVAKVERVNVNSSNIVSSIDTVYDIVNYRLRDNSFDLKNAVDDVSLGKTTMSLPRTSKNTEALLSTGDIVRITFYYIKTDDSELLFFSKNGNHTTDKRFATVERISVSSGFINSLGNLTGEITVSNTNQPRDNTSYDASYSYRAPKENERITITFNTNNAIRDATLSIENVRPITADVLVKAAIAKAIDITVRIVKTADTQLSDETIIQNASDTITTFLNANSLGTTIDASDVINVLYTVSGVDRVTILNFSTSNSGNLASITAEKNEFLQSGIVDVQIEER